MASLEYLQKDAEEIRKLISLSQRPRVKDVLQRELLSVEQEISLQVRQVSHSEQKDQKEEAIQPAESKAAKAPLYTKTISSYCWDQSEKFVKIYITLSGVESLPKDKITSKFTKNSVDVLVHDLDGKNHQLKIMKLCHNIVVDESYVKVKTGSLAVMMKKEKIKQTWEDVVMKAKEKSPMKTGADDNDKDPQKAIMDLMKKMYDEGDDEMKKTINKAWTESMNKAATGEGLNMSGL